VPSLTGKKSIGSLGKFTFRYPTFLAPICIDLYLFISLLLQIDSADGKMVRQCLKAAMNAKEKRRQIAPALSPCG
jgi:hypothetical protein